MDLSRPISSTTRFKSTFSGACDTSPIRLCRIVGMLGIELQTLSLSKDFLKNGILRSALAEICLAIF